MAIATKSGVLVKNRMSLDFGSRQRTLHVLYLLSIRLLQNIANTLFDIIREIKCQLL